MQVILQIPTALRHECGGRPELELMATTVGEMFAELAQLHPRIYRSVCDETGAVRPHLHVFLNSQYLRTPEGFSSGLQSGDVLAIMTAVSGG